MSDRVKLSQKLSKDEETNGLDALADSILENPHQVICAITWLVPSKGIEDYKHGGVVPVVEVARIEPIGTVDKVPHEVIKLAAELYEKRLQRTPLPFDVTETIHGGYVNPDSGDREDMDA